MNDIYWECFKSWLKREKNMLEIKEELREKQYNTNEVLQNEFRNHANSFFKFDKMSEDDIKAEWNRMRFDTSLKKEVSSQINEGFWNDYILLWLLEKGFSWDNSVKFILKIRKRKLKIHYKIPEKKLSQVFTVRVSPAISKELSGMEGKKSQYIRKLIKKDLEKGDI